MYSAVWEQLALAARSTMFDPAAVKMSGAYWPLTTACFLVRNWFLQPYPEHHARQRCPVQTGRVNLRSTCFIKQCFLLPCIICHASCAGVHNS